MWDGEPHQPSVTTCSLMQRLGIQQCMFLGDELLNCLSTVGHSHQLHSISYLQYCHMTRMRETLIQCAKVKATHKYNIVSLQAMPTPVKLKDGLISIPRKNVKKCNLLCKNLSYFSCEETCFCREGHNYHPIRLPLVNNFSSI